MVIEKAKRLVEHGKDVVILLDSITRLARAYNTVDAALGQGALGRCRRQRAAEAKRFFGAARNIEEGGSLTIIATALIDTGSRMDDVIFEEFKGTGNMEIDLDRKLADRASSRPSTSTLRHAQGRAAAVGRTSCDRVWVLRKVLNQMSTVEAMELLLDKMSKTKKNEDFLNAMSK